MNIVDATSDSHDSELESDSDSDYNFESYIGEFKDLEFNLYDPQLSNHLINTLTCPQLLLIKPNTTYMLYFDRCNTCNLMYDNPVHCYKDSLFCRHCVTAIKYIIDTIYNIYRIFYLCKHDNNSTPHRYLNYDLINEIIKHIITNDYIVRIYRHYFYYL